MYWICENCGLHWEFAEGQIKEDIERKQSNEVKMKHFGSKEAVRNWLRDFWNSLPQEAREVALKKGFVPPDYSPPRTVIPMPTFYVECPGCKSKRYFYKGA